MMSNPSNNFKKKFKAAMKQLTSKISKVSNESWSKSVMTTGVIVLILLSITSIGSKVIQILGYITFGCVIGTVIKEFYPDLVNAIANMRGHKVSPVSDCNECGEEETCNQESYYTVAGFEYSEGFEDYDWDESEGKPRYLFDVTAFFEIQAYLKKYGCTMDEVAHADCANNKLVVVSESMQILCEALHDFRCMVTMDTREQIEKAEDEGKLSKGTIAFIEDYMSFYSNPEVMPEKELWVSLETAQKHYKEKYYKLLWDALGLRDGANSPVYIVTCNKKLQELAGENSIGTIQPLDFDELSD